MQWITTSEGTVNANAILAARLDPNDDIAVWPLVAGKWAGFRNPQYDITDLASAQAVRDLVKDWVEIEPGLFLNLDRIALIMPIGDGAVQLYLRDSALGDNADSLRFDGSRAKAILDAVAGR